MASEINLPPGFEWRIAEYMPFHHSQDYFILGPAEGNLRPVAQIKISDIIIAALGGYPARAIADLTREAIYIIWAMQAGEPPCPHPAITYSWLTLQ